MTAYSFIVIVLSTVGQGRIWLLIWSWSFIIHFANMLCIFFILFLRRTNPDVRVLYMNIIIRQP